MFNQKIYLIAENTPLGWRREDPFEKVALLPAKKKTTMLTYEFAPALLPEERIG